MNSVCLNSDADLILAGQVRHGKRDKGPCSMGALSWLGKKPRLPEFRLIDTPESIHNYMGFFFSAVLQTKQRTLKAVAWKESLKYLQRAEGACGLKPKYPRTSHKKSNDVWVRLKC